MSGTDPPVDFSPLVNVTQETNRILTQMLLSLGSVTIMPLVELSGVVVGTGAATIVTTFEAVPNFSFFGNINGGSVAASVNHFGGDFTNSGTTLTLGPLGTAGTYGDSTHFPIITTNAGGRITNVTTQAIAASGVTTIVAGTNLNGGTITTNGTISVITGTSGTVIPLLSTANSWSEAQRSVPVALTSAATITPDFSLSNNFYVTLTVSGTLANPTNAVPGQAGNIEIIQDGTGGRTLALGTAYLKPGGTIGPFSTAAASQDILSYYVNHGTSVEVAQLLAFS